MKNKNKLVDKLLSILEAFLKKKATIGQLRQAFCVYIKILQAGILPKEGKMTIIKGILKANMGSCECGSVFTAYEVDTIKKTVTVKPQYYAWMNGSINNRTFSVPYVGETVTLPEEGYHLIVKKRGENE